MFWKDLRTTDSRTHASTNTGFDNRQKDKRDKYVGMQEGGQTHRPKHTKHVFVRERGGERESDRQTERETERERERQREGDRTRTRKLYFTRRERDTHTQRQRETERDRERQRQRERGTKALAPKCLAFLWNLLLFVLNRASESASQKTQICGASHTGPLVHVRHVTYDAVSASAHNMVTLSIIEWVIGRHKSHLSHGHR